MRMVHRRHSLSQSIDMINFTIQRCWEMSDLRQPRATPSPYQLYSQPPRSNFPVPLIPVYRHLIGSAYKTSIIHFDLHYGGICAARFIAKDTMLRPHSLKYTFLINHIRLLCAPATCWKYGSEFMALLKHSFTGLTSLSQGSAHIRSIPGRSD